MQADVREEWTHEILTPANDSANPLRGGHAFGASLSLSLDQLISWRDVAS